MWHYKITLHSSGQNFLALCASSYYNDNLIHRNIKDFMVQTGDPTGTGKGGTSIWGRKFEDEFHETLKVGEPHRPVNVYQVLAAMTQIFCVAVNLCSIMYGV